MSKIIHNALQYADDWLNAGPIKLSFDRNKRLYKKCIGTKVGPEGVVRPRVFWLGSDQQAALAKARILLKVWQRSLGPSSRHWTDADERFADLLAAGDRKLGQELADVIDLLTERLHASGLGRSTLPPTATAPPQPTPAPSTPQPPRPAEPPALAVRDLIVAYTQFAKTYYLGRRGEPSSEVEAISAALSMLKPYERTAVASFGPLALKKVREAMTKRGWARRYINAQTGRIKRMFRWGTENEMVPATVLHALQAVAGLRRGRTEAREGKPVKPVSDAHIEAVRQHVSEVIRDMIDLQLLTGMRPGELVIMRTRDIDRRSDLWGYRPDHHKTEHHGADRVIYLGPAAQAIVGRYLNDRRPKRFLFSPADAERKRRKAMHEARVTPLSCGNRPGKRSGGPGGERSRKPGNRYTAASYRRAITRAADPADVPSWYPHQLRHNAATLIRKQFDLEAAQAVLGHRTLQATQIYAEKNTELAMRVMAKVG